MAADIFLASIDFWVVVADLILVVVADLISKMRMHGYVRRNALYTVCVRPATRSSESGSQLLTHKHARRESTASYKCLHSVE